MSPHRLSLHSQATRKNFRRPPARSVLLTDGEYKGWRCFGPYLLTRQGKREASEYYVLKKDKERKTVKKELLKNQFESDLKRVEDNNKKPFLDWIG